MSAAKQLLWSILVLFMTTMMNLTPANDGRSGYGSSRPSGGGWVSGGGWASAGHK